MMMRVVGRSPLRSRPVFRTRELLFVVHIVVEFATPPSRPVALPELARKVHSVDRRVTREEERVVDERSDERAHDRCDDTRP